MPNTTAPYFQPHSLDSISRGLVRRRKNPPACWALCPASGAFRYWLLASGRRCRECKQIPSYGYSMPLVFRLLCTHTHIKIILVCIRTCIYTDIHVDIHIHICREELQKEQQQLSWSSRYQAGCGNIRAPGKIANAG